MDQAIRRNHPTQEGVLGVADEPEYDSTLDR